MNFGWHTSQEESFKIMDRALELGINFFDTADVYGWGGEQGDTEEILGRWFAQGGAAGTRWWSWLRRSSIPSNARPTSQNPTLTAAVFRLTIGRSAEGEIKHACRLVSLRSEAAGVSSLGCISAALEVNRSRTARWSRNAL